ncbi:ferredoxin [Dongia sp.]|uniref:ferredoxin n=1 Tax=Dongia sp. TaxID=1977262 RepID=UPI003751FB54
MSDKGNIAELSAALRPHGMRIRGGFALTEADEQGLAEFPDLASAQRGRTLLLIGNAGAPLYEAFFAAGAIAGPNPLDDWTRRIVLPIAAQFAARAAFPSDGPPWLPFQRWAMRAEGVKPSPLGVLIHPEYGLWHAYRAALVFDQALELPPAPFRAHPCDSCVNKPCLSTCPAGAVSAQAYAVDNCARHVASAAGKACRSIGCLARRACPVGADLAYPDRAMAFHMAAFLRGRGLRVSHPEDSESVH